jgi:hypothetical protein
VGRRGFEPRTYGLKVHSSAIELAARGFTGYLRHQLRTRPHIPEVSFMQVMGPRWPFGKGRGPRCGGGLAGARKPAYCRCRTASPCTRSSGPGKRTTTWPPPRAALHPWRAVLASGRVRRPLRRRAGHEDAAHPDRMNVHLHDPAPQSISPASRRAARGSRLDVRTGSTAWVPGSRR